MTYDPNARDRSYWLTEATYGEAIVCETTEPFNHYERVIPVGTRVTTIPGTRANAGFNGITVGVLLEDGTKVYGVSAGRLQPYSRKTTVDLVEFHRSHGVKPPRGRGGWLFRHAVTGQVINRNGTYTEARRALPKGAWILLP